MKNSLEDVHNHLIAQLERLGDESLSDEELEKELSRTQAIVSATDAITKNSAVMLKASELKANYSRTTPNAPVFLLGKD